MKKRITKIVGVVLSLALLSSLAMVAAPVTAAPGTNAFGAVTLPAVAPDTDVELLAVAADGTLFASVYDDTDWTIYKSTDGGWTWTATKFKDHDAVISAIVCAPNWGDNDTFYVGTEDGEVYRCIDAGAAEPVLLRAIVGNDPDNPEDLFEASEVYDMDLWTDGGSMWIMVATDIDVLVMEDALFAEWIDMDLTISFDGVGYDFQAALICRFAPDFDQSGLIWTILRDEDGDAWLSATISPGQWGQVVNDVEITNDGWLRHEIDLDFASWYSSTSAPVLFAAMGAWGSAVGDDLYLIEGGFDADASVATPLEVDGGGIDFQSIQVDNEVIMGGEFYNANVWISRNGGDTFNEAVKPPTGNDETQVLMAPGDFDPDEGVAYAATRGPESAFSFTMDGGDTWNQTAFVDTEIDVILDMAFSTATASQPAVLITDNNGDNDLSWPYAESVWRTGDITADTPQWERVYCTTQSENWDDDFELVTYAMDGSSILLSVDIDGDNKILKSTDNGQTWSTWRTLPSTIGDINDWVVYDSATVFAACEAGFYGTTRFGPAKQRLTTDKLSSIALQPGFDPNDPDNDTLLVGCQHGYVYVSDDGGSNWGIENLVGTGYVYVAFDQLDPSVIYYATSGSEVGTAVIDGDEGDELDVDTIAALEDSTGVTGIATAEGFSGIWVAPDNALYAIGGDGTTFEDGDLVAAGDLDLLGVTSAATEADAISLSGLPITVVSGTFANGEAWDIISDTLEVDPFFDNLVTGTLYIQTAAGDDGSIDINAIVIAGNFDLGEELTPTEGTIPGTAVIPSVQVSGDAAYLFRLLLDEPYNIWETEARDDAMGIWGFSGSNFVLTVVDESSLYGLEDTLSGKVTGVTVSIIGENSAKVSWSAMTGAELYEIMYDSTSVFTDEDETSITLSDLDDDEEYTVQVRVATDEDFQSRWSTGVEFTTLQAIAQPENLVPSQGMQNAPLLPSFVWTEISNAVEYEFQLSTDPAFGTLLVDETLEITAYTLQTELAYDTNHYWRVRAVSDTGTKSTWCFSNFHTRTEAIPPVTVEPPPTPNITLPAPQVTVIPPDVNITLPAPQVTVVPPDITVDVPDVVTVTQQAQPTLVLPEADDPGTPVYIWVIVGIGAILTIAVIVLIIRTRRVV